MYGIYIMTTGISFYFNSFMTEAVIIEKSVHSFSLQITGLVSI